MTAPYDVKVSPRAVKAIRCLPRDASQRVLGKIEALAGKPRPHGAVRLQGHDLLLYRLRTGDYRILYCIDDEARLVLVLRVGNRRDVYRS